MHQVFQCLPEELWVALGQAIQDRSLGWSHMPPFNSMSTSQISIGRGCQVEAAGRTFGEGVYLLDALPE